MENPGSIPRWSWLSITMSKFRMEMGVRLRRNRQATCIRPDHRRAVFAHGRFARCTPGATTVRMRWEDRRV